MKQLSIFTNSKSRKPKAKRRIQGAFQTVLPILTQDVDVHLWRLEASGRFSSKSSYRAFFNGSITFEPWHRVWRSWAPAKCKLFLWLAIRNTCWTADRLARRGLPHPSDCPFCDQEEENIQYLLTTYVLARDFW